VIVALYCIPLRIEMWELRTGGLFGQNIKMPRPKYKLTREADGRYEYVRLKGLTKLPPLDSVIYFIVRRSDDRVLYIGQSCNVSSRIRHHKKTLAGDVDIYIIPCAPSRINDVEAALIRYFTPPRNVASVCKDAAARRKFAELDESQLVSILLR
jgi:hypothetical protein